jgi:hypothetical protein
MPWIFTWSYRRQVCVGLVYREQSEREHSRPTVPLNIYSGLKKKLFLKIECKLIIVSARIRIHLAAMDPYPDPYWEYGSRSATNADLQQINTLRRMVVTQKHSAAKH